MEPKVREACTARIKAGYAALSETARPNISVGTKNSPCGSIWSRKKMSASGTIVAEILHGANGRGSIREASSAATEAPCITHDRADVL